MTGTPLADLLAVAGQDWHIERVLGMWTAEKSDPGGRNVHFLVAPSAGELADKILAAGQET